MLMDKGDYPTLHVKHKLKYENSDFIDILYFTITVSRVFNNEHNSYPRIRRVV